MRRMDLPSRERFRKLCQQPPGKDLLAWLKVSLDDQRKANDILEGLLLIRGQGCAITLAEIVGTLEATSEKENEV